MIKLIIPKLPFIEKEKTLDFYVNNLDFQLLSDYGDYFLLAINEVELHFFSYPSLDPKKSDFMVYFRFDENLDFLYSRLMKSKSPVNIISKLEIKPWKQKEFAIIDPNGTLLTFGQSM